MVIFFVHESKRFVTVSSAHKHFSNNSMSRFQRIDFVHTIRFSDCERGEKNISSALWND